MNAVSLTKAAPKPVAFVPYEIPLRLRTCRVRLVLPEDFNVLDAERLCRVIHAIALPAGRVAKAVTG